MKAEAHRRLSELRAAQGSEHGKLVQKLLAVAFLEAGATRLVERAVQGIDLEVTLADGRAVALEVKTTEGGSVLLGAKDLQGLEARRQEGLTPYVAALGHNLLDEWVFARVERDELRAGVPYPTTVLRAWRDRALERVVADTFPAAVLAHGPAAAAGGQGALNAVLERHPAYARA
jgi:hypothetical protein